MLESGKLVLAFEPRFTFLNFQKYKYWICFKYSALSCLSVPFLNSRAGWVGSLKISLDLTYDLTDRQHDTGKPQSKSIYLVHVFIDILLLCYHNYH